MELDIKAKRNCSFDSRCRKITIKADNEADMQVLAKLAGKLVNGQLDRGLRFVVEKLAEQE